MVSQYTWPNFRGGSDRDGVRILIQQQDFDGDVVYGVTKIFIRSPQTLFMLEQARARLIPGIVIFLQVGRWKSIFVYHLELWNDVFFSQKLWRGAVCRRRYRRLVAGRRILAAYRRYKLRVYLCLLLNQLRHAAQLSDYGLSRPWPRPPVAVADRVALFRAAYQRWRAWMVIRAIPEADWPQLRLKVPPLETHSMNNPSSCTLSPPKTRPHPFLRWARIGTGSFSAILVGAVLMADLLTVVLHVRIIMELFFFVVCHGQITATDVLLGKRASYGLSRRWLGDYVLREASDAQATALANVRHRERLDRLLFAHFCVKFNQKFKAKESALIVGERALYKVRRVS